jgi:TPR repeat protein
MGKCRQAQLEIGKRFLVEKMWSQYVPMDAAKAVEWLKVASQDSTANTSAARANDLLSHFYAEGRPEYGIPESWAQCEKYMTMAARQGHAFAQTQKGANAEDGSVDQVTWFTLAAAQGLPEAMHRLGKLYFKRDGDEDGAGDLTKSWFTSMYWLRQAALRRHGEALVDLCYVLIHARREVFGHLNVVGHSALPEAAFWMEIGEKYVQGFERPSILAFTNCDNCFVRMSNLKKCAKCKAMGYCSVECQRLHWKAGHKVCCKAVDTYRALFDRGTVNEMPLKMRARRPRKNTTSYTVVGYNVPGAQVCTSSGSYMLSNPYRHVVCCLPSLSRPIQIPHRSGPSWQTPALPPFV